MLSPGPRVHLRSSGHGFHQVFDPEEHMDYDHSGEETRLMRGIIFRHSNKISMLQHSLGSSITNLDVCAD